jgi:hypothetical protein
MSFSITVLVRLERKNFANVSLSEFDVLETNRNRHEKEVKMWKKKADQREEKLRQEQNKLQEQQLMLRKEQEDWQQEQNKLQEQRGMLSKEREEWQQQRENTLVEWERRMEAKMR